MIVVNTFALALAQRKIVGIFTTSLIGMVSMEVSGIVKSCTANTCVFVIIVVNYIRFSYVVACYRLLRRVLHDSFYVMYEHATVFFFIIILARSFDVLSEAFAIF